MKISLVTIGSTGDVRPYILLGKELKKRGHTVTIGAFANFEKMARDAGLEFYPLSGDVVKLMANIMKPTTKGINFLTEVEKSLKDVAPVLLRDLMKACEGADAMCCTFFGSLYYSIAEKYKIPCIQTHYFPMDSNNVTPISSAPGQKLGKVWNRTSYRLGYLLISILEKRYLTKWREENGMSAQKLRTTPAYDMNGDLPVLYAMSPMILPRPREWGENIRMTGFWCDNEPVEYTPPDDLVEFLENGEQPIYIGFGSMVSGNMNKTFTTVIRAIRASKVRAVVNLGWGGDKLRLKSNSRIYFGDYIPHDWLFPRVKAVVHHGGAGTTAAGLRYGKPTLIVPFGGDQPFWGTRVHSVGCGPRPLPRQKMTVQRLSKALIDLTTRKSYAVAAEEMAQRLNQEDGMAQAADLIEKSVAAWYEARNGKKEAK